jgi:RNA polymerase sigma-70 factor (ECF subfamily)
VKPARLLDLVRRAQSGDRAAVSALFDLYRENLRARINRKIAPRLRGKVDVEDILQSGIKSALESLPQFEYRGPDSFLRWLSTIVERNLYAKGDLFRTRKRSVARERRLRDALPDASGAGADTPTPSPGPATTAAEAETAAILRECVERLGEPHRTVMLLELEGKNSKEIADLLGRPDSTIRNLRKEARDKLKPFLRAKLGSWPPRL